MIIKCDSPEDADELVRKINECIAWQKKNQAETFAKISAAAEQLTKWKGDK